MKTLLTGATGFVGARVLRSLVAAGHHVRALVRPNSDRRNLTGIDCEIVTGDLVEPASLSRALRGCEAVFHVAADYRLWVPDPEKMHRTNVQGTVDLFRAAAAAGVSRIVYTSSVATLRLSNDGSPVDEKAHGELGDIIGVYKQSKFLAEREVKRLVEDTGIPVIVVKPTAPFGPGDIKPTPTGRMIVEAASGRMPAYVNTGLNVVHVDDVAAGHLLRDLPEQVRRPVTGRDLGDHLSIVGGGAEHLRLERDHGDRFVFQRAGEIGGLDFRALGHADLVETIERPAVVRA
jgi:dihydroflavonol-4-reductase